MWLLKIELILKAAAREGDEGKDALVEALRKRRSQLMGTYQSVATTFADLHDTPVRMKAKGCVNDIIVLCGSDV
jgi:acetyl-CoA carboxylase / biotin carboxylase 1